MMARIRDAEHSQYVAELKQKISLLELKNEEMVTEGELRSNLDDSEKVRELQDKVADLKAEVMRLQTRNDRWFGGHSASHVSASRSTSVDTESEHDDPSDLQLHLNSESSSPEISPAARHKGKTLSASLGV